MKTATLPAVRVAPEVREQAMAVLEKDETLSMFIASSLRQAIAFRESEREFLARGIASAAHAKATGITFSAEESLGRLRDMLEAKKRSILLNRV
jgi:hypothetical protein